MLLSHPYIGIAFRFINFISLLILGWYVAKKYLRPIVGQMMLDKQQDHDDLIAQIGHLKKEDATVQSLVDQERGLGKRLLDNARIWSDSVAQRQQAFYEEKQHILVALNKRQVKENQAIAQRLLEQAVFPKALHATREELEQLFKNPERAQAYIASVMTRMNER